MANLFEEVDDSECMYVFVNSFIHGLGLLKLNILCLEISCVSSYLNITIIIVHAIVCFITSCHS